MQKILYLVATILLTGVACGDWLTESPPNYAEIRSYFSDPIFYTAPYAGGVSRAPVALGSYGNLSNYSYPAYMYPTTPFQSEFRDRSLAAMQWEQFNKNWSSTMDYVQNRSSLRIYRDGGWVTV